MNFCGERLKVKSNSRIVLHHISKHLFINLFCNALFIWFCMMNDDVCFDIVGLTSLAYDK